MTANLLDEDFDPSDLHPADLEQILEAAFQEYAEMSKHTKERAKYRRAYNKLVDLHTEKRGWQAFNYL